MYGVVSGPGVARQVATDYFMAVLPDIPVHDLMQRPVETKLQRGVWYVNTTVPKNAIGIQLFIEICQSNGRVLKLTGAQ
jgi:hypothetical protein